MTNHRAGVLAGAYRIPTKFAEVFVSLDTSPVPRVSSSAATRLRQVGTDQDQCVVFGVYRALAETRTAQLCLRVWEDRQSDIGRHFSKKENQNTCEDQCIAVLTDDRL